MGKRQTFFKVQQKFNFFLQKIGLKFLYLNVVVIVIGIGIVIIKYFKIYLLFTFIMV